MDEEILKCEITLDRIFYPKYAKSVESGEYSIFSGTVLKVLESYSKEVYSIKLKGTVCKLEYGTTYKVYCQLAEHHEQYGDTYTVLYISKCLDISSKDKQKEFLRNIIHETYVDRLFDKFDDVISLLENKDTQALTSIKGIGNQVALRIIDEYQDSKDYSSVYMELGKLGFTQTFIKKLVDFYNSPDTVIDVVRNNPYDLIRVEGIGFKKADEIACKVGIGQFDIKRIKGFLIYFLTEQAEVGKSYVNYEELMKALYDTLGFVPEDVINTVATIMLDNKDIIVLEQGNTIALTKFYNLENKICNELIRLQIGNVKIQESDGVEECKESNKYIPKQFNSQNWKSIVKDVELQQGFEFTEEQKKAIELSLNNNVIAITGAAGCGKTSTANGICSIYKNDHSILACALSGKASVRITEATSLSASTIHRALGYQNGSFIYDKANQIPIDIVLIDEATMINGTLFLSLLEAIPTGAKVIIMGDVQQLTPIGNCQVFADILDSDVLPITKLTKPHRQALKSGIIPTSLKISNQEQIFPSNYVGSNILGELEDMELNVSGDSTSLENLIVEKFQEQYNRYNDIIEVQICVPMRLRGSISCYNLNNKIQALYNPQLSNKKEIEIFLEKGKDHNEDKKYILRERDKVLNTKNNYKCVSVNDVITPVFNGNIGIIKSIEEDDSCIINFIGIGDVIFSKSDSKNLELAYACTVHKMQGSGFSSTIVGMDNSSYIMNNSELLYTAVTRAKKYCVLIGTNGAIKKAINTKEVKSKQTFLKQFLISNKEKIVKR